MTELDAKWRDAFVTAYDALSARRVRVLLATYFGQLQDNLDLACKLPVDGLHIDAINAREEIDGSHEAAFRTLRCSRSARSTAATSGRPI